MFIILLIIGGENIATPPEYIFVFVNKVFKKINAKFRSRSIVNVCLIYCKAKYSPEKYLRLSLRNISQTRQAHKKNGTAGHQMKSLTQAMLFGRQMLVWKKRYDVEQVVFQA